jgi:hypothetical protein
MPEYADKEIISEGITNRILTPAAYSDISEPGSGRAGP